MASSTRGPQLVAESLIEAQPGVHFSDLWCQLILRISPDTLFDDLKTWVMPNSGIANSGAPRNTTSICVGQKARDGTFKTVIRDSFESYRDIDRNYLLQPSSSLRALIRQTFGVRDGSYLIPAAFLRHHIKFLLVLKGVIPCATFSYGGNALSNVHIANGIVFQCLIPVLDRFDLHSYGFRLHYVARDVRETPGFIRPHYKENWIFANTQDSQWPTVGRIFIKGLASQWNGVDHFHQALEFPAPRGEIEDDIKLLMTPKQRY